MSIFKAVEWDCSFLSRLSGPLDTIVPFQSSGGGVARTKKGDQNILIKKGHVQYRQKLESLQANICSLIHEYGDQMMSLKCEKSRGQDLNGNFFVTTTLCWTNF